MRRIEEKQKERERKAEILGIDKEKRKAVTAETGRDDRIARDLGIPYHESELKSMKDGKIGGFMLTLANSNIFHRKRRTDCTSLRLVALWERDQNTVEVLVAAINC